jgi:RNA polymerase sigma factor (sigma-70 family)
MEQTANSLHPAAMATEQALDVEKTYATRRHELIRFLVSFGVSSSEAEDITQEAFLRVFNPSAGAERPRNLFRWLLVCAKNLAINRYRRNGRETTVPEDAWRRWENALSDSAENLELHMQEKERRIQVSRALDMLSPVEQQCLLLRSQGFPFREIANDLDVPLRRAVYLTNLALRKVQRRLGPSI